MKTKPGETRIEVAEEVEHRGTLAPSTARASASCLLSRRGESLGLGVYGRMTGDCGDERLLVEPVQEGFAARHARGRPGDIAEERDLSESIPAAERREGDPLPLDALRLVRLIRRSWA